MPHPFVLTRRVEFCETDAAGIAHFSSFLCYMEQAEHALLRSLGTSVVQPLDDGWHLSWPRVHVECDYRGTARFEDTLQIAVAILRLGGKSLTYGFEFRLQEEIIATGKTVAVCCRVRSGMPLESIAIPLPLRQQLGAYTQETRHG
ncbi:MAG: acyl-CoA thioesterase [Planctomycetales bacterium]|nr:acyl-CoA thioesterase [Planctomycetales bacterium]